MVDVLKTLSTVNDQTKEKKGPAEEQPVDGGSSATRIKYVRYT